jgi:hypothetical protein
MKNNPITVEGPTRTTTLNWHIKLSIGQIGITWRQYEALKGFGCLQVSTNSNVAGLFGRYGLREVLPANWRFDSGNVSAGSPNNTNVTRAEAVVIVRKLAQDVRMKLRP